MRIAPSDCDAARRLQRPHKIGSNPNGIQLASNGLSLQTFTQFGPGYNHEEEVFRPPLFHTRLDMVGARWIN